jgi:hypothetical protein
MILYKEAENIITYLRYDVGQLELLYTVKTRLSQDLREQRRGPRDAQDARPHHLEMILKLIETEGRQVRFLKFFHAVLTSKGDSILVPGNSKPGQYVPHSQPLAAKIQRR